MSYLQMKTDESKKMTVYKSVSVLLEIYTLDGHILIFGKRLPTFNLSNNIISGYLTKLQGLLLTSLAYFSDSNIVEIGCGRSTSYIVKSIDNRRKTLYSIDINLEKLERVKKEIYDNNKRIINNIVFICGDSSTIEFDKEIGFLFIDGDHTYDGLKRDFEKYYSLVKPEGFILIHDYGNSGLPDVTKYCNELKEREDELGFTVINKLVNFPTSGLCMELNFYDEHNIVEGIVEDAFILIRKNRSMKEDELPTTQDK